MRHLSGHIPSLDGLRAASILIVLVSHAGYGHLVPGGFGVTVFFFLSGYLITTLLLREHDRYGAISLHRFYLRRLVRLTPPLLVTMAAAILLVLAGVATGPLDPMTLFSQFFFFFNYYAQTEHAASIDGLGVLWSLSIEEHFYLFWPALFILLMRGVITIGHLIGLIGFILIWRGIRLLVFGTDEDAIYVSTDTRFDSLLFGCLLAVMQAQTSAWLERVFGGKRMYLALLLAIVALLISFLVRDPIFRSTFRYSLQGMALFPIFYLAVTRSDNWLFRPLNWIPIRQIGIWSYTMYLCHFVIIKALIAHGIAVDGSPLLITLTFLLSAAWAALVYRFAEKPFQPLRHLLSGPASQRA